MAINHLFANVSMNAWLYILRLKSGKLYIGATTDLVQRNKDHIDGQACRTKKLDPPVSIVYSENHSDFHVVISIYRYLGDIWFSGK